MKLKPDWNNYLHHLRQREFTRIFGRAKKNLFDTTLEIGAGDGFQSKMLREYTKALICTEYDPAKLTELSDQKISYKICDAEALLDTFKPQSFDLIFSSNLMEHLNHPIKVFRDNAILLRDNGLLIHVMPGPFVKLSWLLFFYPNQLITLIEVITSRNNSAKSIFKMASGDTKEIETLRGDLGNNPKDKQPSWLQSQFFPRPHGAYRTHLEELAAYQPKRWRRLLIESGFEIIATIKLPVTSGYGFGFNSARRLLEKLGFSYGYAYIAQKKGQTSPYARYFATLQK